MDHRRADPLQRCKLRLTSTLLRTVEKELIADCAWKLLVRLDDDNRIDVTLPVIFGDRVGRIDHSYAINQKPVVVRAGCQINATDPSVGLLYTVVLSLDPIIERSIDGHSLRICVPCQSKSSVAGETGRRRRHLFDQH